MFNRLLALITFTVCSLSLVAQTTLNRGDLAILGVNSTITPSTQDEISFVCFKDITKGTTLQITDNGYEACTPNQWSSAEGGATFTRTGGTIPAGTVMTLRDAYTSGNPIRFTSPDAGWTTEDLLPGIVKASYLDLNSKGDQMYMAQNGIWTMLDSTSCTVSSTAGGSTTTPNGNYPGLNGRILFGFSTSGSWQSLQTSTGESGLYPGMGCFSDAIAGASKYNKYTGSLAGGTQTEWLARINNTSNWNTYTTSNGYFAAAPDFSTLKLKINANGLVPTPTWSSPKSIYCTASGTLDLNTLVTGTKGGSWSGTGVSGGGLFNPFGLAGNYAINYLINYNSGTGICPLSQTDTINVGESITPTFSPIADIMLGSVAPILPTSSTNIPPITGTWNSLVNTSTSGTTNYTFTPNTAKCSPYGIVSVKVIIPAFKKTSQCLSSKDSLRLTGVSTSSKIVWYKEGSSAPLKTAISLAPTQGVTVAKTKSGYNFLGYMGVAVDKSGNVFVSDWDTTTKFTINGNVVLRFKPGAVVGDTIAGTGAVRPSTNPLNPIHLYNPGGLYVDTDDSLYVTDMNHSRIIKFPPYPNGDTGIIVADLKSTRGATPDELNTPNSIYIDASKNVFIADYGNNRIQKWAPGDTVGVTVAANGLTGPIAVSQDKNGNLYVVNDPPLIGGNCTIIKYPANSTATTAGTTIASNLNYPTSVFFDELNDMYVTLRGLIVPDYQLLKYPSGSTTPIVAIGKNGAGNAANQLYGPCSVWVKDGVIYVGDYGNSRVQKWASSIDTAYYPTQKGTYYATITHYNGQIDTSNTIEVGDTASHVTYASICAGDSYTFNGVGYTTAGKYTAHILTTLGCDSTDVLILTVKAKSASTTNITTCPSGIPYSWNGLTFTAAGTQTAHLTNSVGCDSAATLVLTVSNTLTSTTNLSICSAQLPYHWNGLTFTSVGSKTASLNTSAGCDSLATLVLTVNNPTTSSTIITACSNYTWHGTTYTKSGTYTFDSLNAKGCDSTSTINLTINNPSTSSTTIIACSNYTWNGVTYTKSGTYTYSTQNAKGCDSIATLILTINNPTTSSTSITACSSYTWNGTNYIKSGTYNFSTQNAKGCDSTATLILTVHYPTTTPKTVTACSSYTWNGTTYTTSGTYDYITKNGQGCYDTARLLLTITYPTTSSTDITACGSYTWNNRTYTNSGTYTYATKNALGCDSIATLNLTINYKTSSSTNITACSSYTWNNTTYTTSGTYTYTIKNSFCCDSTATLVLTINSPTTTSTTIKACSNYTWNGTTYNKSGTYTYASENAAGCDNTATLNLTINLPTTSTTIASICPGSSYTFNGNRYSIAGSYVAHLTNSSGCDSIANLVLSIKDTTSSITTVGICPGSSYTFNGITYSNAGIYNAHLTNSVGCDSTAQLILYIKDTTSSVTRATICGGSTYIFNGSSYNASGTYTAHLTNSVGCDSTAKLELTVVYGYTIDTITGNNAVCINQSIPLADGTAGGIWKSSDTTIASIDSSKGKLNGLNIGSTTISYTVHFQCGTVTASRIMPVLGVQPQSTAIPHDASCTNLFGGSLDVAIQGNEGPFQFSFLNNNYTNPYTIRNLSQGTYAIYVYNRASCLVDSVTGIILLLDKDANCDTIYIPQGFVPTSTNVTGVTKLLRPYGGGNTIKTVHFRVLNRYGNVVFESHDLFSGWDGRVNGVLQETGTYIWFLDYILPNGMPKSASGTTVLIK